MSTEDHQPPFDRLAILLEDYKVVNQAATPPFASVAAIIATVIASALSIFTLNWAPETFSSLHPIRPWLASLAPLALLLPATYSLIIGTESALQSYYCRALEREMKKEIEQRLHESGNVDPTALLHIYPNLPIFTSHELSSTVNGTGQIRRFGTLTTALFTIAFAFAYLSLLRQTYINLLQISDLLAIVVTVCYAGIAIEIARRLNQTAVKGREFFARAAKHAANSARDSLTPRKFTFDTFTTRRTQSSSNEPSPCTTGLIAKPDDILKLANPTLGAFFAWLLLTHDGFSRIRDTNALILTLGILLYELVIYQGRYVVNDLIGIPEEMMLASRLQRRRLPMSDNEILKAVQSLLIRTGLIGIAFTYVIATDTGWSIIAGFIALVALTAAYETARKMQHTRKNARRAQYAWAILQYPLVCLGLPLRFLVGFLLYTELHFGSFTAALKYASLDPVPLSAFLIWNAAYSLSSVTPTWSLEGLAEATSAKRGIITFAWNAEGKRHVWISTRHLLRCLDVLTSDSKTSSRQGNIVPELSGHQCWIDYSPKNTSYSRRLLRWGVDTMGHWNNAKLHCLASHYFKHVSVPGPLTKFNYRRHLVHRPVCRQRRRDNCREQTRHWVFPCILGSRSSDNPTLNTGKLYSLPNHTYYLPVPSITFWRPILDSPTKGHIFRHKELGSQDHCTGINA